MIRKEEWRTQNLVAFDEIIPIGIVGFFITIVFLLGIVSFGTAFFLFLLFGVLTFIIVRRIKFGKNYGLYPIPRFACHIYDRDGLLCSFKVSDWKAIENPSDLLSVKAKVKRFQKGKVVKDEEEDVEVDYYERYLAVRKEFLLTRVPDPTISDDPLELKISNTRDVKAIASYSGLKLEERKKTAEIMRAIMSTEVFASNPPKVHQIASLSAGVYIFFFAEGTPTEYATTRSKQIFKKWRVFPWISGFPVVELFGAEIDETHEVAGQNCRTLLCFPIMDEKFRNEKALNILKFSVMLSSLTEYTKHILRLAPHLDFISLIAEERNQLKTRVEVLSQGQDEMLATVRSVATMNWRVLNLLAQVSTNPNLPEPLRKEINAILQRGEEEKSRFRKFGEKFGLVGKEEEKKLSQPPETVPSTTVSQQQQQT